MTIVYKTLRAPLDMTLYAVPEGLRALTRQLAGYAFISGSALAVDVTIYWWLFKALGIATVAAAGGYVFGVLVHYMLSSRIVFAGRFGARGVAAEASVLAKFFVAGGLGLAITVSTVGLLADVMGAHALTAKLIAAGLSFMTVFTVLRVFVFNAPTRESA